MVFIPLIQYNQEIVDRTKEFEIDATISLQLQSIDRKFDENVSILVNSFNQQELDYEFAGEFNTSKLDLIIDPSYLKLKNYLKNSTEINYKSIKSSIHQEERLNYKFITLQVPIDWDVNISSFYLSDFKIIILRSEITTNPFFYIPEEVKEEFLGKIFYISDLHNFSIDFNLDKFPTDEISEMEDIIDNIDIILRKSLVLSKLDFLAEYVNEVKSYLISLIETYEKSYIQDLVLIIPLLQLFFVIYILLINNQYNNKISTRELLWRKGARFWQILKFEFQPVLITFVLQTIIFLPIYLLIINSNINSLSLRNSLLILFILFSTLFIMIYISLNYLREVNKRIKISRKKSFSLNYRGLLSILSLLLIIIIILNLLISTNRFPILQLLFNLKKLSQFAFYLILFMISIVYIMKQNIIIKYFRAKNSPNDLWYSYIRSNKTLSFYIPLIFFLLLSSQFLYTMNQENKYYLDQKNNEIEQFSDITINFGEIAPNEVLKLLNENDNISNFSLVFDFKYSSIRIENLEQIKFSFLYNTKYLVNKYPFQNNQFINQQPQILNNLGENKVIVDKEVSRIINDGKINAEKINKSSLESIYVNFEVLDVLNYKIAPSDNPSIYFSNSTIDISLIKNAEGSIYIEFKENSSEEETQELFSSLNDIGNGYFEIKENSKKYNSNKANISNIVFRIIMSFSIIIPFLFYFIDKQYIEKFLRSYWEKGIYKKLIIQNNLRILSLNILFDIILLFCGAVIIYLNDIIRIVDINLNQAGVYYSAVNFNLFISTFIKQILTIYFITISCYAIIINWYSIYKKL